MSHGVPAVVACVLLASAPAVSRTQSDSDVAARITALMADLDTEKNSNLTDEQWDQRIDRNGPAIRAEITRFIETRVHPAESSASVEHRLRSVTATMSSERIDEESDLVTARVEKLRYGNALLVAYTVPLPFHGDRVYLDSFRDDGGRYRRIATTASEDFDRYSLSTRRLASPMPGVDYLLAFGSRFTFNGRAIRFRVYAFDGSDFETIWSPDDMFSAEPAITARGFTITHTLRHIAQWPEVTDEYLLLPTGVVVKIK